MPTAYLRKKVEERASLADLVSSTLDKAAKEDRDPSNEERTQLDNWELRCKALDDEIGKLDASERGNRAFTGILNRLSAADEAEERNAAKARDKVEDRKAPKSFGEQFVESDAFKSYQGRGTMVPVEFEGFLEQRAAISLGSLEGLVPVQTWSGPTDPTLRTPLLDVIGHERVSTSAIEYVTWSETPVAGGPIDEGEVKPEAELTPKITPVSLETYAHWKAVTRQALEDLPRIRSIVETKLRSGLSLKLEQIATAVLLAGNFATVPAADPLTGVRVGIGEVQANGFQPNAVLLNPADYAAFDIAAAEAASSGPVQFGSFWNLRPVPVPGLPVGTQIVGDFNEALTWFDRGTGAVYMTDSHADYFVRNLLLLLAEIRAAFAATNLAAAVKVVSSDVETAAAPAAKAASK